MHMSYVPIEARGFRYLKKVKLQMVIEPSHIHVGGQHTSFVRTRHALNS